MRTIALTLLVALLAAGCVRITWSKERRHEDVGDQAFQQLTPGTTTLETCLDSLGAPLIVEEYKQGAFLIYAWQRGSNWSGGVSVEVGQGPSVSYSYGEGNDQLDCAALWFNTDLVLEQKALGKLGEFHEPVAALQRLRD